MSSPIIDSFDLKKKSPQPTWISTATKYNKVMCAIDLRDTKQFLHLET
jgi:hypothetical protein